MWFNREISDKLRDAAATRPVVLLTGARQTGKTSLLKRLFPASPYISFDLPLTTEEARTNPETFLKKYADSNKPAILDEIQYAPELFRYLKVDVDQHRTQKGRWLLTGSHRFQLMTEVTESLAGRISILELESLRVFELGYNAYSDEQILLRGGYPELWQDLSIDPYAYYQDYLLTYIQKDMRQLVNISDLRSFITFTRIAAARAANLINYSDMARDTGVSPTTAKSWMSILEASHVAFLLTPYAQNLAKQSIKAPKLYFRDTGLLLALLQIRTLDEFNRSVIAGALFENFVVSQLISYVQLHQLGDCYFLRHKHGLEIDLVIIRADIVTLIECKLTETPNVVFPQAILEQVFPKKTLRFLVACRLQQDRPVTIGKTTLFNPLRHSLHSVFKVDSED